MAKFEIELDDVEIWSAVMGSSPYAFGNHYKVFEFIEGDWDIPGKVHVVMFDEVTGEETGKMIRLKDIVESLPKANEKVWMDLFDLDSYDAICADAILQVAVLGDVVYG